MELKYPLPSTKKKREGGEEDKDEEHTHSLPLYRTLRTSAKVATL